MPTSPLTRDRIVEAAFEVLDELGVDGLTVRAVAARLGVKAPALYWHLDSKQVLLDEMGTVIARRIDESLGGLATDASLAEGLHAYAHAARAAYLEHRDGARTFSGTRLTDADLLRRREGALARLVGQGHSVEQVTDAFEVVTAYVVGFVIEEQERADAARYSVAQRDEAVGEDFPLTRESGHRSFSDPGERFAQHLGVIVPALAGSGET